MTRQEAEQLIESSRAAPGRRLLVSAVVILAITAFLIMSVGRGPFADSPWLAVATPWVLMLALVTWRASAIRRQRRILRQMMSITEAAELNDWRGVGQHARALLSRAVPIESVRAQAMLLLAGSADRAQQYEASELLFENILSERRADAVQLHQAMIGLVGTKLRSEQLTDAVTMLDKLRRAPLPAPLQAGVELARLFQEVLMGHHELSVAAVETRRPLFRRYLSTRAGYGYGLIAAAMHAVGRVEEAAAYWRDATLLVSPSLLIERYEMLGTVAQTYPASESPL